MKKWLAIAWLTTLLAIILSFFWYNQLVYSLPTPIPAHYKTVHNGEKIRLGKGLHFDNHKPVFLHFFNPDCPCSRFNVAQFKTLVKTYHNQVNFAVVLMTAKPYTPAEIRDRFGIDVPIVTDSTIASACGVYSTPQAVVLNAENELYYRGNYNKNRYCTDEKSSYAKIAVMGILHKKTALRLDQFALKAYGCTLPNCNN
ncbi:hypothetical protein SAMN06265348_101234 [Pedobacter westerhofensis]|uniref:DUF6436 domain-containing protein n=1 Tax=Pedobacter westerhofensis TaxID=425512 RepID=A0A521AIZ6_9SPHI|nr:thioredoxin fold domain-containing protein [Pedobacter westerhofensis]SMO34660.1 hypothetical protein SAMN06265348_101234 [Pedobacter westerhofensis]